MYCTSDGFAIVPDTIAYAKVSEVGINASDNGNLSELLIPK